MIDSCSFTHQFKLNFEETKHVAIDQDLAAQWDLDVADPYYGSAADFERVLEEVEEGCRGIIATLVRDGAVQPA